MIIQRIVRRANPANEEELRNCAIQAVANERWLYSKGKSEATSLDGLASVTLNIVRKEDRMELLVTSVVMLDIGEMNAVPNHQTTRTRTNFKEKVELLGRLPRKISVSTAEKMVISNVIVIATRRIPRITKMVRRMLRRKVPRTWRKNKLKILF